VERRRAMIEALGAIAPGRPLREGLDRILQASMGALVVVGDGPEVLSICSGGFLLDAEFSPQRLSELAKMDGAIILASDASRIARANVHLVPNPQVATSETGTRHRTAERVARSIDVPVIAVSEDLAVITVYRRDDKRALSSVARLLARANQALQTLERYRTRLDAVISSLTASEVEDLVTVHDVVMVLQRAEMVHRIAEEVEEYVVELGSDGRLILLQLEELMAGIEDERLQVMRDYLPGDGADAAVPPDAALEFLSSLSTEELLVPGVVAAVLGVDDSSNLDNGLQTRGFRLLSRIPRVPPPVVDEIVARFGTLSKVVRSGAEDLEAVDDVTPAIARLVKEGLARQTESSILDRYS
jgi:diadenylate cyclase